MDRGEGIKRGVKEKPVTPGEIINNADVCNLMIGEEVFDKTKVTSNEYKCLVALVVLAKGKAGEVVPIKELLITGLTRSDEGEGVKKAMKRSFSRLRNDLKGTNFEGLVVMDEGSGYHLVFPPNKKISLVNSANEKEYNLAGGQSERVGLGWNVTVATPFGVVSGGK
ncbi:MAG: hypothetical protein NTY75_02070 [Candidatus Shapirobacteria bacterium]|nr:hypothetical protein [Candidatus Shapirobacteria bacterium]